MNITTVEPARMVQLYAKFRAHFDHRLTRPCTDKMRIGDLTTLIVAFDEDNEIGVSGIYEEEGTQKGFTVVLTEERNQDVGTSLLRFRYSMYPNVYSYVWEGNLPSVRMCQKAGLPQIGDKIVRDRRILVFGRRRGTP